MSENFFHGFMGIMTGMILVCFLFTAFDHRCENLRAEAVRHGYAEWIPNEKGETKFQWKEPAK